MLDDVATTRVDVADAHDAVAAICRLDVVPKILDVVCEVTGLGFSAVARVTDSQWVACAVRDRIGFGLVPGDELRVETTICHEIRASRQLVVIDDVRSDPLYCAHPTPRMYGLRSYISVPIVTEDGRFFGTLCAISPEPARLNTPATVGMFTLFADLIAMHLDARDSVAGLERAVTDRTAALVLVNTELSARIAASEQDRMTLSALTEQLDHVLEHERARVARELHDEFGQALTALKLDIAAAQADLNATRGSRLVRSRAALNRMDGIVDGALDSTERIVSELRPAILDTLGCVEAARWLVAQFAERTRIDAHFVAPDIVVSEPAGTAIFRALQEALTNVSRHAKASRVAVNLTLEDTDVVLRVGDNGRGLGPADCHKLGSFGLRGMAERLRALGGSVTLDTPAGGGTELRVRVPASRPGRWSAPTAPAEP